MPVPKSSAPVPDPGWGARLGRWVLGRERRERSYVLFTLTAITAYGVSMAVQWHAVSIGIASRERAVELMAAIVATQLVFFALVRAGVFRHRPDPALLLPQMVVGVLLLAWAYHINPLVRGGLLGVAALIVGYSSLTSRPGHCLLIGGFLVLTFGMVIGWGAWTEPARFPPEIEMHHFGLLLMVVPILAFIASRQSATRLALREQRRRLSVAMLELERIATHDVLTDLPNRRHIQDWLPQQAARSRRRGEPLCLAVLDLDHFKRVNDTRGHAAGDQVLRRFASLAVATAREGDLVGRWGGEEFLWAMAGVDAAQALRAIDRLREAAAAPENWAEEPGWTVDFSAGITVLEPGGELELALRRADAALYAAKAAGRGCSVAG